MVSPSMQQKLKRMQAAAPFEVPKAWLCAQVILASAQVPGAPDLLNSISTLKVGVGAVWSEVTAFQYMSGQQAEFVAQCAPREIQPQIYLAHLIAKEFAAGASPLGIEPISKMRITALQQVADMWANESDPSSKA